MPAVLLLLAKKKRNERHLYSLFLYRMDEMLEHRNSFVLDRGSQARWQSQGYKPLPVLLSPVTRSQFILYVCVSVPMQADHIQLCLIMTLSDTFFWASLIFCWNIHTFQGIAAKRGLDDNPELNEIWMVYSIGIWINSLGHLFCMQYCDCNLSASFFSPHVLM